MLQMAIAPQVADASTKIADPPRRLWKNRLCLKAGDS
ncbi:hypothetical protein SPLC1_S061250 [Arthrospira platensis C1]|uniref:Uncharacterized protein n=1 Tax=Limnospira maxima CS-328 TaxID=513049 RepID=B5W089_LIMMA|nr:hypothetical protein AmaxDRAFT_2183 [Limnospira maxima CS-328]EKD10751.1 hypothetical protein SPLC1_S061250 [Arthrospira platensis C1]